MKTRFYIFNAAILCVGLTACTDQYTICNQSKISNLNSSFRTISGTTAIGYTASLLSASDLTSGIVLFNQKPAISGISSNLSLLVDSTTYSIKVSATMQADTFTVYYNRAKLNLSVECGEIDIFNINRIKTTNNSIDSITIANAAVNNSFQNNINIYF